MTAMPSTLLSATTDFKKKEQEFIIKKSRNRGMRSIGGKSDQAVRDISTLHSFIEDPGTQQEALATHNTLIVSSLGTGGGELAQKLDRNARSGTNPKKISKK